MASASVADAVSWVALLAEGLSMVSNSPEALSKLKSSASTGTLPEPEVLAAFRPDILAFIDELRSAREQRRQRALAAVAAARMDQTTGLPGVSAAQSELERAIAAQKSQCVGVLVIEQLRMLNARFGRAIGDMVFGSTARHIAKALGEFGVLYRWNGPAFLLIASAGIDSPDKVIDKLSSIATSRIDNTVEVEDRALHVKTTFSFHVQQIAENDQILALSQSLDDVVAARLGKQTAGAA